jgi:hypothetical protein
VAVNPRANLRLEHRSVPVALSRISWFPALLKNITLLLAKVTHLLPKLAFRVPQLFERSPVFTGCIGLSEVALSVS